MPANICGKVRFITSRFSSTYDTPEGQRRLSSSTYIRPSLSRTRSVPVMWHQMPRGGFRPAHGLEKALARGDQPFGHDAVANDLLIVIEVVDEQVQRVDPLLQTPLDARPLVELDDPRQDVERPDLLGAGRVAVDVEGDAHVQQGQIGRLLPPLELALGERLPAAGPSSVPRGRGCPSASNISS